MSLSKGVTPTGPGHSRAEPEEVSVVPTSVPNAVPLEDALRHWGHRLNEMADECITKGSASGIHCHVTIDAVGASRLAMLLEYTASAIEARRAETQSGSVEDESAVGATSAETAKV